MSSDTNLSCNLASSSDKSAPGFGPSLRRWIYESRQGLLIFFFAFVLGVLTAVAYILFHV